MHVCIGDVDTSDRRVVAYCSYAPNTTLGFVEYKVGLGWQNTVLDEKLVSTLPPSHELYMWVGIGDPDRDSVNELVVAMDSNDVDNDSIWLYHFEYGWPLVNVTDFSLDFVCPELIVGDVDNDGWDEIVCHTRDTGNPLYGNLSVCEMDSLLNWVTTLIENTSPPLLSMCVGDVDVDGEFEFLYVVLMAQAG